MAVENPYEMFGLSTPDPDGHGVAQGLDGVIVPEGVALAGVSIPPNENGIPPGPAILITFRHYCQRHGRTELTKYLVPDGNQAMSGMTETGSGLRAFADLIARIADKLADPDIVAEGQSRALDAMAHAAATADPALAPRCPGCGTRLFGEVADRGACYSCFPATVPDDVLAQARPLG